jgi:hypothetical protein
LVAAVFVAVGRLVAAGLAVVVRLVAAVLVAVGRLVAAGLVAVVRLVAAGLVADLAACWGLRATLVITGASVAPVTRVKASSAERWNSL